MSPSIGRAVAGLLGATAALLWSMCLYLVARSGFSSDPGIDPHGYGLMFGTVVGLIAGLLAAVALPAALPADRRGRATRRSLLVFVTVTAVLYAAVFLR
ncbi:MAG: hypothetical protein PGN27_11375 [Mycolicibacterium neoaurum]|uniref:hypothetical protein n=1 Tax=Mycolicibacterium neoaurum TaxID=1795 RepID=UPI002FF8CC89